MEKGNLLKTILIGVLIFIGLTGLVLVGWQIFGRRISRLPPTIAPPRLRREKPTPTPEISLQKTQPVGEATLSLDPAQGNFRLGEVFEVVVQMDTKGEPAVGIDAIVNYDPNILEVVEITPGTLFTTYFRKGENKEKQKIYLNAAIFTKAEKPFVGQGVFGTIKFRSIKSGKTTLSFEYIPRATGDSNVTTAGGLDFLTEVIGGEYLIQ